MYHAWLQPTAPHWTHAAAAALQDSQKGASGGIPVSKVTEGNMGRKTVILSLNTPEHCLSHIFSHRQIPQWSRATLSLVLDHIPDFPKHALSSPLTPSHLGRWNRWNLWSPPNSSNAPNQAHANPDAVLCWHGLQDSRETACAAAQLEQHLGWKAWQCRPGTCSGSQC